MLSSATAYMCRRGFSVLSSFGSAAQELLDCVVQRYRLHVQVVDCDAHAWIYCKPSFDIMCDVAYKFVGCMVDNFVRWMLFGLFC